MTKYNDELTPQQELYCKAYTTRGDTFGSGVKSYAYAFDYTLEYREDGVLDATKGDYNSCKANASKLMHKDKIKTAIREMNLDEFNDQNTDSRLQEILVGGKDADSIQAIKIYNDLKQRITKKVEVTNVDRPFAKLTDKELEDLTK